MEYRPLGNTGIKVSMLGFGAMRLPSTEDGHTDLEAGAELLCEGFKRGINFVDSAETYGGAKGESEKAVGLALKQWSGKKVYVSTKLGVNENTTVDEYRRRLEEQLERLQLPCIDIHNFHGLSANAYETFLMKPGGLMEAARKAQEEGLISHVACSCHDKPENMVKLIDSGEIASMILQYNLLMRANEPAIARARERNVGIIVMGPVGGGKLGFPSEKIKIPSERISGSPGLALSFVFANPGVSTAISGMSTLQQVVENVETAERLHTLSEEDHEGIRKMAEENQALADLYCTGCRYCMPCPNLVNIPGIFDLMNLHRVWGVTEQAKKQYAWLLEHGPKHDRKGADACVECGECEPKCPQNIPIMAQLKESHEALR